MMVKSELNDSEFQLFSDYIFERSGIHYTINKKTILQNRIRRRLRELNLESYKTYYDTIKNKPMNDPEVIKFFDEVTTNETSFFRHDKQFKALEEMIIPEILAEKKIGNLNIWSAAASMGKEAYTIAMVLSSMNEMRAKNFKILGTDLNQKVLDIAAQGEYDIKDIKGVDPRYKKFLIEKPTEGLVQMVPELKKNIEWKRYNLKDSFTRFPKMDIIFCRNVFIYFPKDIQREIVAKFYDQLNPVGFFILGHSETLNGISDAFEYRKFKSENLMIYQKVKK